jgi:hypothetical protein
MMAQTQQLTKGMYGHQFQPKGNLFGLYCGQCRSDDFVHNGGWYNRAGEKLGWGDLSPQDFQRISDKLDDGELFIVLYESDSFWNFVTHNPGIIGSMCATKPTVGAPGVDYVAKKCCYIIASHQLYYVDRYGNLEEHTFERKGLQFTVLKRDVATKLIAS